MEEEETMMAEEGIHPLQALQRLQEAVTEEVHPEVEVPQPQLTIIRVSRTEAAAVPLITEIRQNSRNQETMTETDPAIQGEDK